MNQSVLRRLVKEGSDDGDEDDSGDAPEAELDDGDEDKCKAGGEDDKGSEVVEPEMSGALVCILT
jgi:hypothetical protein